MATNVVKTPLFRAVASRSYSRTVHPIGGHVTEICSTILPNKMVVAGAENGSPISRLSVVVKAGSRYERPDNQGAAHMLRIACGLSTYNHTHFAIVRNIQQVGATLTCTADRETIAYTLEGTRDAVERSSEYLSDIITSQLFKPWEISDSMPRLKLELAQLTAPAKALNFLHRAAFRTGLGNSLYCSKHNVGKVSSETLQHFVCENFLSNRVAVVGLGINNDCLIKYASNINLHNANAADTKSNYYGGEIRSEKGGELAYVAIGLQGGKLCNENEALAFAILQRAYGIGPYCKRGNESSGIITRAAGCGANPVAVSTINACYSDNGLFGALVAGPAKDICESVVRVVQALRAAEVTEKDIKRAKRQLATSIFLEAESGTNYIDVMGQQALHTGTVVKPNKLCAAIEALPSAEVIKVAKNAARSKLSIASVGNISNVPYLDELN